MDDQLEALLRDDAQRWRTEVDAVAPDFDHPPALRRRRITPYAAALVAAALVIGVAVLVVTLRPNGSRPGAEAGGSGAGRSPVAIAPLSAAGRVPQQARCPTSTGAYSSGMGFGVSRAAARTGKATLAEAVRAAGFGPHDPAAWHVLASNRHATLLASGPNYLHVIRLADGSWFVDSGGSCGSGHAFIAR